MHEVRLTSELRRVAALPRRSWPAGDLAQLIEALTAILSRPSSTCADQRPDEDGLCSTCKVPLVLRPVQALGLHDAGLERGLFGSIGVGEGKTLLTLMLPLVLGLERPLLMIPGGLVEKTLRDRERYSKHWKVPTHLRITSLDLLSRVEYVDMLDSYAPDGIIVDEVHRLKNRKAAVTRRVARYMHEKPETVFCGVSGTVMDKSILDFAHIQLWALKLGAPMTTAPEEICEWAAALDVGTDPWLRPKPGALTVFAQGLDLQGTELAVAQQAFQRRMTDTAGVVATVGEGEHVDCSIYVRAIIHKSPPVTEENFRRLRGDDEFPGWVLPGDTEIDDGKDVWRHALELGLGLHYEWNPPAPEAWLDARRNWGAFVRKTISRSRTYDSELHIANAVDAGDLADGGLLAIWRAIEPDFIPNVVPVWHEDSALQAVAKWMRNVKGLVWTEHGFFAAKLSELSGVPYYGAGGFEVTSGAYIEDHKPKTPAIASIDANREGKNLQRIWSDNLVVCPPSSAAWLEQLIARTHRPGQRADEVTVDIFLACRENFDAIVKAIESARATQNLTGKKQKLLMADITLPAESDLPKTPRWVK